MHIIRVMKNGNRFLFDQHGQDELHENEVRYVVVKNLGSEKPAKIKIWAEGTTYSTLTMDGFKRQTAKR